MHSKIVNVYFTHAANTMLAWVLAVIMCLSVCVCVSVTQQYRVKMAEHRIMQVG